MTGWELPEAVSIGGKPYRLCTDYRQILTIFSCLQQEHIPEFIRWHTALNLFYGRQIPEEDFQAAAEYFCWFANCGREEKADTGVRLIDWEQDAQVIVADINKVAGQEIRRLPYLHWWTFLGWFHGIGEGGLSTLVNVRDKLNRGKKLEPWEQEYYRRNKNLVKLQKKYSPEELAERERLEKLLA